MDNIANIDKSMYHKIRTIIESAKRDTYRAVNFVMVQAYWEIGREIVEVELKGKTRAKYGEKFIQEISAKLTKDFGKGFDKSNIWNMCLFYKYFPIPDAVRRELSWTHYRLLLKVSKDSVRQFYMQEAISNQWSTRELERQINALLYERIVLSRNKRRVKDLSCHGHIISKPKDLVKDPYVLEFLGLQENRDYLEKDLENGLINKMQSFLLELGKGFSFVARQQRITLNGDHFYIDLVFYNRLAKCFVLIDLKVGKLTHQDIGQMQMYLNYYTRTQMCPGENDPIGILLCAEKNDAVVQYTLPKGKRNIFASKYKLYLPTEDELRRELLD